ncbi:hypothetical protein DMN91_000021 [Ooceraea biroi]|uniref:Uncharacterized protein n=1 Tax=Ooceraea biroi TaxID=2015173 RepID=A0A3L8E2L2_OOCBI|nr:hypothetical protein DMN91_000021 [Ooceraea biroi]
MYKKCIMNAEEIIHENVPKHKYISSEKLKDLSTEKLISSTSITSVCSSELHGSKAFFVERKQQIIDSDWGGYALDLNLWDDSRSPIVQIKPSELSLDNKESRGFLSDRLIGPASSFLTRSPENGLYILGKCVLRNRVPSKMLKSDYINESTIDLDKIIILIYNNNLNLIFSSISS